MDSFKFWRTGKVRKKQENMNINFNSHFSGHFSVSKQKAAEREINAELYPRG